MASEIRVNRLSNRSGLSTITFANGGVQFSGITTFANGDFRVGTGATILNPSTNEMQFHTGGSNRLTINNAGLNLGIGSITVGDATFTGSVSIGKTLTYEDVKNVDSIGIVTARTGVKITGGDFTVGTAITASSVTGNVTNDVGITTYSGSAVWFKGATANKDMYWSHASGATVYKDNAQILMGDGSDLQLSHDGSHSNITNSTGDLNIISTGDDVFIKAADDIFMRTQGDEAAIHCLNNGPVELYYDGNKKFETVSAGVNIPANNLTIDANNGEKISLKGTANPYIRWYESSTAKAYIQWNSAGYLHIENEEASKSIKIDSSGATVSGDFVFGANAKAKLFENGVQSGVQATNSGSSAHLMTHDGAEDIHVDPSGYMKFEVGGSERLRITSAGKMGLGTNNPTQYFHVVGNSASVQTEESGGGIVRMQSGGSSGNIGMYSNHDLLLRTNSLERLRINSDGKVLIGHTGNLSESCLLQVARTNDNTAEFFGYSANANGARLTFTKSRNGTIGTNTVVQSGDVLGEIHFRGADGSGYFRAATIGAYVDGTPGTNDMPGRLVFSTTADGASSQTERLRITSDGNFYIGNNTTIYNQTPGFMSFSQAKATNTYEFGHKQLYLHNTGDVYLGCDNYSYNSGNSADTGHKFYNRGDFPWYIIYGDTSGPGNTFGPYIVNKNSSLSGTRFYVKADGGVMNYQSNNGNVGDAREKNSIVDAPATWNSVKQWKLRKFKYNREGSSAETRWGFIAQEIELIHPELVKEDYAIEGCPNDGIDDDITVMRKEVKEQQLQMMSYKALQEAMAKIETLEAKVAALESP